MSKKKNIFLAHSSKVGNPNISIKGLRNKIQKKIGMKLPSSAL